MTENMENLEGEIRAKVKQLGDKDNNPNVLFKKLYKKALELGLSPDDFSSLESVKEINASTSISFKYFKNILVALILLVVSVVLVYILEWPVKRDKIITLWFKFNNLDPNGEECFLPIPESLTEYARPPVNCNFCKNVSQVDRVFNITPEEFGSLYAYSGRPVIITDAAQNWTAPDVFSFEFFKSLYTDGSPALENTQSECQFFPYRTNFNNLGEVFNMSDDRAKMKDGSEPWYIGWSNCEFSAASILRKHYQKPYFLPKIAESRKTDWIFMGSPGYGAFMHIDNVDDPSWQAQVTGTKKWTLEPPSECYFECKGGRLEVTVHPGEIIVLDTNIWYHGTLNVGDDISITIGSEYD